MYFKLVHLIAALVGTGIPTAKQVDIAADVQDIALEELPFVHVNGGSDYDDRKMSACIATVWWNGESAFNPGAEGDNHTSFGVGQMKKHYFAFEYVSVPFEVARTDRKESMRASWRFMRQMVKECGSVPGGLGKYASGVCGGAKTKVTYRLMLAKTKC